MRVELNDELLDYLADQYIKYNNNTEVTFNTFVDYIVWSYERRLNYGKRTF